MFFSLFTKCFTNSREFIFVSGNSPIKFRMGFSASPYAREQIFQNIQVLLMILTQSCKFVYVVLFFSNPLYIPELPAVDTVGAGRYPFLTKQIMPIVLLLYRFYHIRSYPRRVHSFDSECFRFNREIFILQLETHLRRWCRFQRNHDRARIGRTLLSYYHLICEKFSRLKFLNLLLIVINEALVLKVSQIG